MSYSSYIFGIFVGIFRELPIDLLVLLHLEALVPFGKYCLNNRLVFSLGPRCHGPVD